jgi:RNA polymerase sigma-70 factor (ECF subfamily)
MDAAMVDAADDTILAARARSGDREAFGRLAERYRPRLEALVRSRMGAAVEERLEVEDVVQEAFARALGSIESFQWQGEESFLRWLGGIAEHLIRKAGETAKRKPELSLEIDPPAPAPSACRALRREERFARLERALARLPEDQREVIRLFRIEGLKHAEIASRTGRSPEAVRQIAVRALRRLRDLFGKTDSLGLPDRPLGGQGDARGHR